MLPAYSPGMQTDALHEHRALMRSVTRSSDAMLTGVRNAQPAQALSSQVDGTALGVRPVPVFMVGTALFDF